MMAALAIIFFSLFQVAALFLGWSLINDYARYLGSYFEVRDIYSHSDDIRRPLRIHRGVPKGVARLPEVPPREKEVA